MLVYKFLPCKFGLQAIQNRRLKISTLESTNDPFEFLPFDLTHRGHRWANEQTIKQIGLNIGMLCFSQHWTNPVIWSHYADSHKGVCLGFEVSNIGKPVNYIRVPLPFDDPPKLATVEAMLYTKFDDWKYESEYRIWATADEKENGLSFMNLDHNLVLSRVILGVGCQLTNAEIDRAIGPYGNPVIVEKAGRAPNKFEMQIDRNRSDSYEETANELSKIFVGTKVIHPKLGRNDSCWCGSGMKYKKCHGTT